MSNMCHLYGEALVVGATLIPVWAAVTRATTVTRINFGSKAMLDIFMAGFLYHLLAEELGVNEWYLTNGHAARKVLGHSIESGHVVRDDVDWVRCARSVGGF